MLNWRIGSQANAAANGVGQATQLDGTMEDGLTKFVFAIHSLGAGMLDDQRQDGAKS